MANFGDPITSYYLKENIPEYKDVPIEKITAEDRSKVAVKLMDTFKSDARDYVGLLKEKYGNGVSTLCCFYNATGDKIKRHTYHNYWGGEMYSKYVPKETVENGQWTAFLHVHESGTAKGSSCAIIYRTIKDTDIFLGWATPWSDAIANSCYTESGKKNQWWDVDSVDHMEDVLSRASKDSHSDKYGYASTISTGRGTSPNCDGEIRYSIFKQ